MTRGEDAGNAETLPVSAESETVSDAIERAPMDEGSGLAVGDTLGRYLLVRRLGPPCFAVRLGAGHDRIQRIDPLTGVLGDVVYENERIEDVAVDRGGTHLVVLSSATSNLVEVDLATSTTSVHALPLSTVRSVSIDSDGAVLATGTVARNTYQAGHLAADGTWSVLAQTVNDILSMIRPSVDGKRLLLLSRSYSPWLWLAP